MEIINRAWLSLISEIDDITKADDDKIKAEYFSEMKNLVKAGANLDLQYNDGWTALISASRYSNSDYSLETVQKLIKAGADLDLQNKTNDRCISYLSRFNPDSLALIKYLFSQKISINFKTEKNIMEILFYIGVLLGFRKRHPIIKY